MSTIRNIANINGCYPHISNNNKMNMRYVCVVGSEIPKTWTTGHLHSSLFVLKLMLQSRSNIILLITRLLPSTFWFYLMYLNLHGCHWYIWKEIMKQLPLMINSTSAIKSTNKRGVKVSSNFSHLSVIV